MKYTETYLACVELHLPVVYCYLSFKAVKVSADLAAYDERSFHSMAVLKTSSQIFRFRFKFWEI